MYLVLMYGSLFNLRLVVNRPTNQVAVQNHNNTRYMMENAMKVDFSVLDQLYTACKGL